MTPAADLMCVNPGRYAMFVRHAVTNAWLVGKLTASVKAYSQSDSGKEGTALISIKDFPGEDCVSEKEEKTLKFSELGEFEITKEMWEKYDCNV
jgi:hypothetical protein